MIQESGLSVFFWLPFLPPDVISDVFSDVLMPDAHPTPAIQEFCDYMLDTYISEDALFPPELWAEAPSLESVRTTNGAEAFHRHIKQTVGNAHPNVYILTTILLQLQEETYIKIQSTRGGRRINPADRDRTRAIISGYDLHRNGHINIGEYLKRISFKCLPVQWYRNNRHFNSAGQWHLPILSDLTKCTATIIFTYLIGSYQM